MPLRIENPRVGGSIPPLGTILCFQSTGGFARTFDKSLCSHSPFCPSLSDLSGVIVVQVGHTFTVWDPFVECSTASRVCMVTLPVTPTPSISAQDWETLTDVNDKTPLPSRDQQADRRVGLIPSIKQTRYRRGPAGWQPGGSRFLIQVSEYLVDHRRVFDAGDDAHITTAFTAGFKATASSAIAPAVQCIGTSDPNYF